MNDRAHFVEDHFQSRSSFWNEELKSGVSQNTKNQNTNDATAGGFEESKSINRQNAHQGYQTQEKADYRVNQTFHYNSSRESSGNDSGSILSQVKEEAKDMRESRLKSMRLVD